MKKSVVDLSEGTSIPFDYLDKTPGGENLGRAEFGVVLVFKEKKISEFNVFFLQQRLDKYFKWTGGDIDFTISSYDNLKDPRVWMIHYEPEFNSPCIHVYSPNFAKYLYVDYRGISFVKTPIGKVWVNGNQS